MWFQPPTPPTLSLKGDSSYSEVELPPVMSIPLMWDLKDMYGASKGSRQFSKVVGTIKLDDFIQEFNTWCM